MLYSLDFNYISVNTEFTDIISLSSQNLSSTRQNYTRSLSSQHLNSTIQNYSTTSCSNYISAELELDIDTKSLSTEFKFYRSKIFQPLQKEEEMNLR
ncbi:unnamed protein product [Rhizophagus irregularis]|nr:unnamed protein product [Rhizophagus irregularis]